MIVRILFLGDYDPISPHTGFIKVGTEIFKKVSQKSDDVYFGLYFQDGAKYSYWQKLFGFDIVEEKVGRFGVFQLLKFIIKKKPELIHITSQAVYYLPILPIAKLFGAKLLFHLHNIHSKTAELDLKLVGYNRLRAFIIQKSLLKLSNVIFVLSESEKQTLLNEYNIRVSKLIKIANGVNDVNIKKDYNYKYEPPLKVITVGSIHRLEKGIDFLIDCLGGLNMDINLTVCNSQIEQYDRADNYQRLSIELVQALDETELRKEFIKHDVFISLSRYDAFNLSLLEAMNSGLIFIASERIGLTERYPDYFKNFVVRFGEKNEVYRSINVLLNYSIEDRIKLSKDIIDFSMNYQWDKIASEIFQVYKDKFLN